jgi:hypothetical protein
MEHPKIWVGLEECYRWATCRTKHLIGLAGEVGEGEQLLDNGGEIAKVLGSLPDVSLGVGSIGGGEEDRVGDLLEGIVGRAEPTLATMKPSRRWGTRLCPRLE